MFNTLEHGASPYPKGPMATPIRRRYGRAIRKQARTGRSTHMEFHSREIARLYRDTWCPMWLRLVDSIVTPRSAHPRPILHNGKAPR